MSDTDLPSLLIKRKIFRFSFYSLQKLSLSRFILTIFHFLRTWPVVAAPDDVKIHLIASPKRATCLLFADDTTIYVSGKNITELYKLVNQYIIS